MAFTKWLDSRSDKQNGCGISEPSLSSLLTSVDTGDFLICQAEKVSDRLHCLKNFRMSIGFLDMLGKLDKKIEPPGGLNRRQVHFAEVRSQFNSPRNDRIAGVLLFLWSPNSAHDKHFSLLYHPGPGI